jgi:Polyketide cyclase / dehydrase and lipid transport
MIELESGLHPPTFVGTRCDSNRGEAALSPRRSRVIAAALLLVLPIALASQPGWVAEPGIQSRLAAGEVVVQAASEIDPTAPRGRARAAVRINASPQVIWSVMTDCQQAIVFVPGLKRCRRLDGAPDGRWENIEHEVRYSWLLPTVRYVFRADYDRPRRIDFHRISGDLKAEEGTWLLTQTADGTGTVVQYDVYVDPGFWIPQFLVMRSLHQDLPAALSGLRDRVEHLQAPR